jgi:hypothetical protein
VSSRAGRPRALTARGDVRDLRSRDLPHKSFGDHEVLRAVDLRRAPLGEVSVVIVAVRVGIDRCGAASTCWRSPPAARSWWTAHEIRPTARSTTPAARWAWLFQTVQPVSAPRNSCWDNLTVAPRRALRPRAADADDPHRAAKPGPGRASPSGERLPGQLSGGQQQRVAIAQGADVSASVMTVRRAHLGAGPERRATCSTSCARSHAEGMTTERGRPRDPVRREVADRCGSSTRAHLTRDRAAAEVIGDGTSAPQLPGPRAADRLTQLFLDLRPSLVRRSGPGRHAAHNQRSSRGTERLGAEVGRRLARCAAAAPGQGSADRRASGSPGSAGRRPSGTERRPDRATGKVPPRSAWRCSAASTQRQPETLQGGRRTTRRMPRRPTASAHRAERRAHRHPRVAQQRVQLGLVEASSVGRSSQ